MCSVHADNATVLKNQVGVIVGGLCFDVQLCVDDQQALSHAQLVPCKSVMFGLMQLCAATLKN